MRKKQLALFSLTALLFTGCAVSHSGASHHGGGHWGYAGDTGPAHWSELSADYAMCGTGMHQSPINVDQSTPELMKNISFNYQATPLSIVNNGHTIKINYAPGSFMTVGGKTYQLLQFHFHAPSEHTVKGKHAPLEGHLVHQAADGTLAVIGVMIEEGPQAHPLFTQLWSKMPKKAGETVTDSNMMIDARHILPDDWRFYHYEGSLTTPPCSENVQWFVLRRPIEISKEQIAAFESLYTGNNRPVQPLNERQIVKN